MEIYAVIHDQRVDSKSKRRVEFIKSFPGSPLPPGIEESETSLTVDDGIFQRRLALSSRISANLPEGSYAVIADAGAREAFEDATALLATARGALTCRRGNIAYVNLTPQEATDVPTFVMKVPKRGELKLLTSWTFSKMNDPRVLTAEEFQIEEQDHGRIFSKREISWPFTWNDLATTDFQAMRAKVDAYFLEHVNPLLAAAYLPYGRDDELLKTEAPTVAQGSFEELLALLQDLTDSWDSPFARLRADDFTLAMCCAHGGRKAIAMTGDPGLKKFMTDIVLPIYQPAGAGYAYNDGPSQSKAGYSLGGHFTECCKHVSSAHETIESRTRVVEWLKAHGHPDGEAVLRRHERTPE